MSEVWAILVAAGTGARFGGPKQYEVLRGRRVLDWSLRVCTDSCDGVICVLPSESVGATQWSDDLEPHHVTTGGSTRSGSVRAGLALVPPSAGVVVVHDAARPLASAALFESVIDAVRCGADASLPGVPLADTIRRRGGGIVDRDELVAVQTPQAFGAEWLRRAHEDEPEATDDVTLVEALGGRVVIVPGEPTNLKITHPSDLVVAAAVLDDRS